MDLVEANALYPRKLPIFNITDKGIGVNHPKELNKNHILILHGGADISPSLYGEPVSKLGGGCTTPSNRDQQEWDFIKVAVELGIPIVGICRGAQMLCAYDGGKLMQHIENHTGRNHVITDTRDQQSYVSNSCHHQMMIPSDKAEVIAYHHEQTLGYDSQNRNHVIGKVPEVVHFPKINALGIQGHPEWLGNSNKFVEYCTHLIKTLLLRN